MSSHVEQLARAFVGKQCTVLTVPVNVTVRDGIQHGQLFSGLCERVDSEGVWLRGRDHGHKSFFRHAHLVGIYEEPFVAKDSAEGKRIEAQLRPKPAESFIDVEELTASLSKLKKN